jgi:hypothetical protein
MEARLNAQQASPAAYAAMIGLEMFVRNKSNLESSLVELEGRQRQHLVCRRKSEQLLSKDQVEGSRFKCSLPHEQRTSNTGTNVRPYGVSEYRTRRGKPCS